MLTAKQKIKIDAIIFVLVFITLIFFGISPLLSELFKTTKDLSSRKAVLKILENQITALQDFQNNSLAYQQNIQKLDSSFVSDEAPVEFIEFLEKLANNQGLEIALSSVKDASEKKGNRLTTAFQATIVGDYSAVLVFLKKIEQSPWLIKIDQVDINRIEEKAKPFGFSAGNVGQVVLKIGFKTFSNYLGTTQ